MSGTVTVRASSPAAQRALLGLADVSTEVLAIGSRIAGAESFQVFFKSASVQQGDAGKTLFSLILERFPDLADDIELAGVIDDIPGDGQCK